MTKRGENDQIILSPVDPYKHDDRLTNRKIVFVRFTPEHGGGCVLTRFFGKGDETVHLYKDTPKYAPMNRECEAIQAIAIATERCVVV